MMIIWCMVPEISSTTDFFVISGYFLSFYPPNNPENQNFGTMKKTPGGIIILNMSTIDENHMMYDSWDMEHNRQIFFLILDHFLLFYIPLSSPLTTQRIKNLKKQKKHLEISSLYTNAPKNHDHMLYFPQIRRLTDVIVIFHFGLYVFFDANSWCSWCTDTSGFNLTTHDLYFTVLVGIFTNHISAENKYFTNHIEWTKHKIMGFKPASRYQIIRQSLLSMISIIIHFFVKQK